VKVETINIQENCINLVYLQHNSTKMDAEVNENRHPGQQLPDEMQSAIHRGLKGSRNQNTLNHFSGLLATARS